MTTQGRVDSKHITTPNDISQGWREQLTQRCVSNQQWPYQWMIAVSLLLDRSLLHLSTKQPVMTTLAACQKMLPCLHDR